jgi:outer membrane lipoprotein SlyB
MRKILFLFSMVCLTGCAAASPVLYPNPHLQKVGDVQAHKDIAECRTLADEYVKSDAGIAAAKSTAAGAAGGAVIGGAAGAVTRNLGRGIGVGAATGAASGLVHSIFKGSEPSPVYKNFVNQCLQEKGYQPIGWQ